MKVIFNDVGEFLTELRGDAGRVERNILRLTIRRRCHQPFVYVSVVGTVVIDRTVVVLDHRLGETFVGEDLHESEVGKKAEAMIERISTEAAKLGIEVRAGVYEPVGEIRPCSPNSTARADASASRPGKGASAVP